MDESPESRTFRTPAFEYADKLLVGEAGPQGKRWTERQEREVLLPLARELTERGGDEALEGMQLALVFESDKNRSNVFAHVIRTSDDSVLRRQAVEYLVGVASENSRSEGLMIAAGSPDTYVSNAALAAVADIENATNQNLVVGAGIRNEVESTANFALNIARTFGDERRVGRVLREGLRSEHQSIRERCLVRARQSGNLTVRNRVLRLAEELGLLQ